MQDDRVVVIGAGAAGMIAAAEAARRGARVCVLEKAPKAGVKILMSGGTRCNLTHDCDAAGIMKAFGKNGKFLRQALTELSPSDVVAMFHRLGVETKVESTGKVFPQSDRALDVCRALQGQMDELGVELRLSSPVTDLHHGGQGFQIETSQGPMTASSVIVTVGGMSYPGCGTTGDGYAWLRRMGHKVVAPRPALVPIDTSDSWMHALQGVTIPSASASVMERGQRKKKRALDSRRGSLLLTHFGLSGPVAMDISRAITGAEDLSQIELQLSFLPDTSLQQCSDWMKSWRGENAGQQVVRQLSGRLPRRLAIGVLGAAGIAEDLRVADMSSAHVHTLCEAITQLSVNVTGTRGFKKAEVTAGGVSLKDVDPRTMQSRKVPGLFVAGEILDLDGAIGGYNFQSAFSSGFVAGVHAANFIVSGTS